jgi:hydrogenase expression/formation protein HypE
MAVLEARGELGFSAGIRSDVAPLNHMITSLIEAGCELHTLRDPTRGGLATTLNEIAGQSRAGVLIDETAILVKPAVKAACEMLGFDPLYIANEGKLVAIVAKEDADQALQIMRKNPYGVEASKVGYIQPNPAGKVLLRTAIGTTRVVDVLAGEILPRIC